MITKKDFIALADSLRGYQEVANHDQGRFLIDRLISFMNSNNPHFNESRWRSYLAGECGPNGGKVK